MVAKIAAAIAVLMLDPASALAPQPPAAASRVRMSRVSAAAGRAPAVRMEESADALRAALAQSQKEGQAGTRGWGMSEIRPNLVQKVEGRTRKTWKVGDRSKDRVHVVVTSEGRPVHADLQLWLGPDWTPFMLKAYSEDGKLRPIQTLIGTRNKAAMIEVRNVGEYEFPINAGSQYADGPMALAPQEIPATTVGEKVDGGALSSFPIDPETEKLEVVLKTDGKQLNARVEILNAPNNPKQTFEVFTNNGELNSLCVCFNTPDPGNTVRVVNLAKVEFPCYFYYREI